MGVSDSGEIQYRDKCHHIVQTTHQVTNIGDIVHLQTAAKDVSVQVT